MSVSAKLKTYLDEHETPYEVLTHEEVFTSMQTAEKQEIPGKEFAKCVVIQYDGKYAMAALPSTHKVNLDKLAKAVKAKDVSIATETEFGKLFPDCDLGAMPPLGQLYNMPLWVDKALAKDEQIVFNAGSHTDTIRIKFKDFKYLANPEILDFGQRE